MKLTVYLVYTLIALLCIDEETDERTLRHYWMNVTAHGVSPTCTATMMPLLDYGRGGSEGPIDWPATLRCALPVFVHQPLTPCMARIVNMSQEGEFDAALSQNQDCVARFVTDEVKLRPKEKWHCRHLANLIHDTVNTA